LGFIEKGCDHKTKKVTSVFPLLFSVENMDQAAAKKSLGYDELNTEPPEETQETQETQKRLLVSVDFCRFLSISVDFCYFCCFLVSLVSLASQAKAARATKRTHRPEAAFLCPTRRPRTHGAVVRRHAAERYVWACGRGGMCH
jgi:hypothetical protein